MPFPKGKHHSLETRRKMRESQLAIPNSGRFVKGRRNSLEVRQKMRINHADRRGSKNPMYGKNKELNPAWKGDDVGYAGIHLWIYKHFGKADKCEQADESCIGRFEWSNVNNEYLRIRENWQQLCRSHHVRYDKARQ